MADYSGLSGYNQIYNDILKAGAGSGWNSQNTSSKLGSMGQQFAGMFRNMVGRDPTNDELSQMFSSVGEDVLHSGAGYGGTDYAGFQDLFNPYIQNTFGPEIQSSQKQQQTSQLTDAQKTIQDLISNQVKNTTQDLTDPNSPTYKAFAGSMNNLGITPSSGAFQGALGSTLGQAASNDISAALGGVSLPAISGIMNTANAPYQMSLNQMYPGLTTYGANNNNLYDFQLQSDLAQRLADASQPSGTEKAVGMTSALLSGLGGAAQGGGAAASATSYVCRALIAHGLASESDLDLLHYHTLDAVWTKARAFWWYARHAKELVRIAEERRINWRPWRKRFLDDPISKRTALEAVEEYITAYKELCDYVDAPHLWDERVRRVGFWDSLPFLPLVLTYPPFIKAARKVFRMKQLWLLDLPLTRMPDESR